jgi:hypothetical protein
MLQHEERLIDFVHQVWLKNVREDGVALLGDPREVSFQIGERAHGRAAV